MAFTPYSSARPHADVRGVDIKISFVQIEAACCLVSRGDGSFGERRGH
jgi:hypothetical protein